MTYNPNYEIFFSFLLELEIMGVINYINIICFQQLIN